MTTPAPDALASARQGMAALKAGRGAEAARHLERAIALGLAGGDPWIALSHAKAQEGDQAGRLLALRRAREIAPDNARAALFQHRALRDCLLLDEAERAARRGVELASAGGGPGEVRELSREAANFLQALEAYHELRRAAGLHAAAADDEALDEAFLLLAELARPQPSQPTRFHYPGLGTPGLLSARNLPDLAPLEARTDAIRGELNALLSEALPFAPYVEARGREGPDARTHRLQGSSDWQAAYLLKQGERNEAMICACPETWAAVSAIASSSPPPGPSVLFSRLDAGAHIPPHHGMVNTRLIAHLPLIVPEGCHLRVGNRIHRWREGEAVAFDDTVEHEAFNLSGEPRYVLIFEMWRPELGSEQRQRLAAFFETAAASARSGS